MHVNLLDFTSGSRHIMGEVHLTEDGRYRIDGTLPPRLRMERTIAEVWGRFPGDKFLPALAANIRGAYYSSELVD